MAKTDWALLGGLTAISAWGYHQYQTLWLPARRFKQLQQRLAHHHQIQGGYIDHRLRVIARGDVQAKAYAAGLQLDGQWYTCDLLPDGTSLHWRQLDVKARD